MENNIDLSLEKYINHELIVVSPDYGVFEIYELMKREEINHVPVVDDNAKTVGIISDRDVKFVSHAKDFHGMVARDIMTEHPVTISYTSDVKEAVKNLTRLGINSVLIHDDNEKICGIFTSTDALVLLYKALWK